MAKVQHNKNGFFMHCALRVQYKNTKRKRIKLKYEESTKNILIKSINY